MLAACGGSGEQTAPAVPATEGAAVTIFQFSRDYIFLSTGKDSPIVAPLTISAMDDGENLQRHWIGWVARGAQWDRFLDTSRRTSRAGGVWGVLPANELQVIAGGPSEVESFLYEQAGRRLRMVIGTPRSDWNQGGNNRFRILDGSLLIGAENASGLIFEVLRVERSEADGWPVSQDHDVVFLTSGADLQLLMSTETGSGNAAFTWIHSAEEDLVPPDGVVSWLEVQPLEEARRDIPIAWTLTNQTAGLSGEVRAIGRDVVLGPERGGRRAVEIRYSVEGSITINGTSRPVAGTIRHAQQ
jgi:hypothetical protein